MQSDRHNDVELNPTEMAEMAAIAKTLRADLDAAVERPPHFWTRQQAQIRERMRVRPKLLRWPIAAMAALAGLRFGLLAVNRTPPPRPAAQAQALDADDLLLQDIQHSLSHRGPAALMPASVLVQEMTSNSTSEQKRDN